MRCNCCEQPVSSLRVGWTSPQRTDSWRQKVRQKHEKGGGAGGNWKSLAEVKRKLKGAAKLGAVKGGDRAKRWKLKREDLYLLEIIPSTLLLGGELTDESCRGRFHPRLLH